MGKAIRPPGADAVAALTSLAAPRPADSAAVQTTAAERAGGFRDDLPRDARVRRLALQALVDADAVDPSTLTRALADPDPQVRRLVMRAAAATDDEAGLSAIRAGLDDPAAMVRYDALHALTSRKDNSACGRAVAASRDDDAHVVLLAIDELAGCGGTPEAVEALADAVATLPAESPSRAWHRAAHAVVALAKADPARASAALDGFTRSTVWQLRMYGARAAAALHSRAALERLAVDPDDNVVEGAIEALGKLAGHDADPLYAEALGRSGYQAVRAAALALDGTRSPDALKALRAAWQRLVDEGHDNSHDARDAIADALRQAGSPVKAPGPTAIVSQVSAADLGRLAGARARVAIRDVGTFDLALFTREAPATVIRFATLAASGYYNGLTFHRVVPNFVVQGGSPGANEYVGDRSFMRDETGLWPHVRGAVGISTRGRDTGDAQIFIDLIDNPRLDHQYTVFAQVLNGMDVVDRLLEGDVIDKVEILAP